MHFSRSEIDSPVWSLGKSKVRKLRRVAWLALPAVAIALVMLANRGEQPAARKTAPPIVQIAVARRSDMDVTERAFGTVLANETVQVIARASGEIIAAHFHEGDFVHRGDVLFEIDPRPYQSALGQAEAVLAKDDAQRVNALADAQRLQTLSQQGAASAQQRDVTAAAAKALSATVEADRENVRLAKLNLEYATVHSPIDGKTGPLLIEPGNVLPANSANPLVVIKQVQPVKVSFSLPQSDIAQILARQRDHGLAVSVTAKNGTERAAVNFVGNAIDDRSGTIELRASLPNRDLSFVPGQVVDIAATLDRLRNVIVVPRQAVNFGAVGRYVYVVGKDAAVRAENVRVLFDDGASDAIAGNVRAGERVVTDGQLALAPGMAVAVKDQQVGSALKAARR